MKAHFHNYCTLSFQLLLESMTFKNSGIVIISLDKELHLPPWYFILFNTKTCFHGLPDKHATYTGWGGGMKTLILIFSFHHTNNT